MHFITCYVLKYISLQRVCYRVWVTRRVKKLALVHVWVKLEPSCGYEFFTSRVRVGGCEYGTVLPDGFLPVAISNPHRQVAWAQ
jgi:hypothetical protein